MALTDWMPLRPNWRDGKTWPVSIALDEDGQLAVTFSNGDSCVFLGTDSNDYWQLAAARHPGQWVNRAFKNWPYKKIGPSYSSGVTGLCSVCASTPLRWSMTIAGITSAANPTMANLNGTFTVEHIFDCIWQLTTPDVVIDLRLGVSPNWALTLGDLGSGFDLFYNNGAYDCAGPNVFDEDATHNALYADTWPATITVTGA